ncbi:MAG: T9SS type A sorting domain-containing protein [Bacteroidales bacterium]|nr:T9SS type A sorting domain-containing protein [Bacteroidales bacterium]
MNLTRRLLFIILLFSINLSIPNSDFIRNRRYNVFPNPVTGPNSIIKIYSMQPEDISLTLFELSGEQAGERKYFNTAAGESTFTLPVEMQKNGMYILSVAGKDWTGYELINIIR